MPGEVILGLIAGTKLSVFALFIIFLYMAQKTEPEYSLGLLYIVGGIFVISAIAEFNYVLTLNQPQKAFLPLLNDIHNLQAFNEVLYIIAGLAAARFFKTYRARLT